MVRKPRFGVGPWVPHLSGKIVATYGSGSLVVVIGACGQPGRPEESPEVRMCSPNVLKAVYRQDDPSFVMQSGTDRLSGCFDSTGGPRAKRSARRTTNLREEMAEYMTFAFTRDRSGFKRFFKSERACCRVEASGNVE